MCFYLYSTVAIAGEFHPPIPNNPGLEVCNSAGREVFNFLWVQVRKWNTNKKGGSSDTENLKRLASIHIIAFVLFMFSTQQA